MPKFSTKKYTSSEIVLGVFLIIVVAIIPLFTKLATVPLRTDEINVIRTGTAYNDVFSHGKSVLIMIMGVLSAVFMAFEIFSEENTTINLKSMPIILIGIYGLLLIISTLFTDHLSVALLGATERYEGMFVWICYIIFFIAAIGYSNKISRAKLLLGGFTLSGFLLSIIGVLQVIGVPVYENSFVSKLIMGSEYKGNNLSIKFDSVFATLYNPNCAGLYFGMISALFIVLAICLPTKSKFKYTSIVVAILSLISTIGTSSVGGLLGLAMAIAFTIIVAVCYVIIKKRSKLAVIVSVACIVIAVVGSVAFLNSNSTTAQKVRIIYDAVSSGQTLDSSTNFYKDMEISGNKGSIITANGVYTVEGNKEQTKLLHDGVEMIPVSTGADSDTSGILNVYNDGGINWNMHLYQSENTSIYVETLVAKDSLGNEKYFMFGEENGVLSFLDKFGNKIDLNEEIPSWGFKGIERLGSNRGYIWSRSIPLLSHNLIWGVGADNYEFEFPQQDVKAKLNFLNDPYVIIDKPHNMYLQFGINTGVLSLVVLLILFVGYIVQTIKSLFNDTDSFTIALKLGIMAGVVAYLGAGLTTDSVVSVAPVFWTLLGMGYGVNLIGQKLLTREERKLEKLRKKIK